MYSHSIFLASALAAGTMAQSTSVTSLFLYGYEGQNIVASVISAAPEATSFFVNCAPGTDGSDVSRVL
jgi:Co/Zn/Cd efflux system component